MECRGFHVVPPAFEGPVRSLDDLRALIRRGVWAAETSIAITPDNPAYLRGKLSALQQILDRLDWPDVCDRCGANPTIDRIEEFVLCHDCISAWMDAQDIVDGETA
jgi:hypothetical protein